MKSFYSENFSIEINLQFLIDDIIYEVRQSNLNFDIQQKCLKFQLLFVKKMAVFCQENHYDRDLFLKG
ncbi:unnamed protein product [Paramecium sonneborni]|uniref:Uncharacterized protein n=1 Tax=Paramecium sonneborni TaxID=65129 RepID=A0A8S1RKT7_9CILI|nr:unnamed protein product [Paramecium sonneborni]